MRLRPLQEKAVSNNSIWSNARFRKLFGAQVISLLGSGVTTVGLALFAYQLVGDKSATEVIGTALMLRILAFLIFSQFAGLLADRISRSRILITADIIRFGLVGLFPFVTMVWEIYLLIFLINAATAFFTPTYEATIPEVVGSKLYVRALSVSRIAFDFESVGGPALAGILVVLVGVRWIFWFDAATYVLSALLVLWARIPRVLTVAAPRTERIFPQLTFGVRLLLAESSLRRALVLSMAEATAGAAAIVATIVYVKDTLGKSEGTYALYMAILGLGSALTSLFLSKVTSRYEQTATEGPRLHSLRHRWSRSALFVGGLLLSVSLLPDGLRPGAILFGFLWALNGAGQAMISISSSTLLGEHTKDAERGRVYSAYFALTHLFWLVAYPAVGYAASTWGAPITYTGAGVFCLIATLTMLLSGSRETLHVHR